MAFILSPKPSSRSLDQTVLTFCVPMSGYRASWRCLGNPLHLGLPWISLPLFTLWLHPPPCAEWVTSSSSSTPNLTVHKTMRVQWCADKWVNWSLLYMLSNGHMGAPPFLVGCDRTPIKTHPVTPLTPCALLCFTQTLTLNCGASCTWDC